MKHSSLFAGFASVSEESVYSEADRTSEVVGEKGGFEPFRRGRLGRSFLIGCALDDCAPSGAWYGLAGFEKIVDKSGFAPPIVVFFPGWSSFIAALAIGPFSFRVF